MREAILFTKGVERKQVISPGAKLCPLPGLIFPKARPHTWRPRHFSSRTLLRKACSGSPPHDPIFVGLKQTPILTGPSSHSILPLVNRHSGRLRLPIHSASGDCPPSLTDLLVSFPPGFPFLLASGDTLRTMEVSAVLRFFHVRFQLFQISILKNCDLIIRSFFFAWSIPFLLFPQSA